MSKKVSFKSDQQKDRKSDNKNKKKRKKFSEKQKRLLLQNYHSSSEDEEVQNDNLTGRSLSKNEIIAPKRNLASLTKKFPHDSNLKRKSNPNSDSANDTNQNQAKSVKKIRKQLIPEKKSERLVDDNKVSDENNDNESNEDDDDELLNESNEIHSTIENPGWADVISKILAKNPKLPVNQQSVVLAKASPDFELVEQPIIKRTSKEKMDWEYMCRHKPQANDKERERKLSMIASQGVVQLFNTIRQQKLERRRNK